MKKLLISPNLKLPNAVKCLKNTVELMLSYSLVPMLTVEDAAALSDLKGVKIGEYQALIQECEGVIAIGGDGTIFRQAAFSMEYEKPVLGINSGRLGFLAQMEAEDISAISRIATGDYTIEERMAIKMTAVGNDISEVRYAINDVVISRSHFGRSIDIKVSCGEDEVGEFRGDGIIFATPTGSTAYSLSAGGPIIDPSVNTIVMTPICPHSLAGRSIVFSGDKTLVVRPTMPDDDAQLGVATDGITSTLDVSLDYVVIEKAEYASKFICFKDRSFYKTLNQKIKFRG